MKIQRCKGMRDLFPEEVAVFRQIEAVFQDCCLKWGYQEVRTPTIEPLHLFTSAGTLTPGMLSKVYSFLDWDGWSGERVVLRPDGTIPVARLYIDGMEDRELAKLFYVTNIFIFDETGTKTRERWQCGAELIGAGSPIADTELISLSLEVLQQLGLKNIVLRLSHAGLIKALLAKLGLSPDEQAKVFAQILDGDVATLAELKSRNPELEGILPSLLNPKGQSSGFLKNLKALATRNLTELSPQLDNFIATVDLLEALNCKYQIDIASGAGFEYYTGAIFQLFSGDEKIGGGGRYDALVPAMGGKNIPASGFALYLNRLINLVKPKATTVPISRRILVKFASGEPEAVREAFNSARRLREAGYVAEIDLTGQEPADLRWMLSVQSKAPLFILQDRVAKGRREAQTVTEVLAVLEAESADKDSSA